MKPFGATLAALVLTTKALPALAGEPMTLGDYMALSGPAPTARIAYGRAPQQYVELFEPAGRGPFPVAALIHGGCFYNKFEGMKQMRGMAGALTAQPTAGAQRLFHRFGGRHGPRLERDHHSICVDRVGLGGNVYGEHHPHPRADQVVRQVGRAGKVIGDAAQDDQR